MKLNIIETEKAIKCIKTIFEQHLSTNLNLLRVSAPKFIKTNTGIQDDLANTCTSVKFNVPSCGYDVEIVHSLAKWKRLMLQKYGMEVYQGLYTDMDAIRKDEVLDSIHSIYVDQWDWELCISRSDRSKIFLFNIVKKIYDAIVKTQQHIQLTYGVCNNTLPENITPIHTEELEQMYPTSSRKERENLITKKYGAVFLIGIGHSLSDGSPHDIRAVDYDDWSTEGTIGDLTTFGLNGDILVWNEVLHSAFELSSMGIRVDATALKTQADIMKAPINTFYHQQVLDETIPFSIGGGIGQSRLCMFLLDKQHIGEVQVSEWSQSIIDNCAANGITLL